MSMSRRRRILGIDIDDFRFDHTFLNTPATSFWSGGGRCSKDLHPTFQPLAEPTPNRCPNRWHEQKKACDIGEESWRQEHRSRHENHEAFQDLGMRQSPLTERLLKAQPCLKALCACESRTENAGEDDDAERYREPYLGTDLEQEHELNKRNRDEEKEQAREHCFKQPPNWLFDRLSNPLRCPQAP
ncbi:MAG: hypothetical protein ACI9DF_002367 [Verrucomicrobiales bacterium]|jgi:hypothetical protein